MTTTPHKHAALIKKWADDPSIKIECLHPEVGGVRWLPVDNPTWKTNLEYRIKPERVYPTTSLSGVALWNAYLAPNGGSASDMTEFYNQEPQAKLMKSVANAAIKQYIIDNGL